MENISKGFTKRAMNAGLLNPVKPLKSLGQKAMSAIKTNPGKATGAALGTGFAAGRLSKSKD